MRILLRVLLLSPLFSAVMPGDARAQMTAETRAFIVSEHNRLRRDAIGPGGPDVVSPVTATAMREIEYDMALECVAQAYINTIPSASQWTHNPNSTADYAACGGSGHVGESWYSGAPQDLVTGGASRAWVDFAWPIAWGGNGCSEREIITESGVVPVMLPTIPRCFGRTPTRSAAAIHWPLEPFATTRPAATTRASRLLSLE